MTKAEQAASQKDDVFKAEVKVEVAGLPVKGYRATQPEWKIDLVNQNKVLEEKILRQIDKHALYAEGIDKRSVQMARGIAEDLFMRLNRAVFQPGRLDGDLE